MLYRLEELIESEFVKEESGHSVEHMKSVDTNHENKPKPHSKIHFLVNDILNKCRCVINNVFFFAQYAI